jgi:class 3 adenylate cyclase
LEAGCHHPVAQAMKAAEAIIAYSAELDSTNAAPSVISIGIDFSSVQMGTWEDANAAKYQYLIMGDSADNVKCLQALGNTLGHHIALSPEAYNRLPDDMRRQLTCLSAYSLTDRVSPVTLYANEKTVVGSV